MPSFDYIALDARGEQTAGSISAKDEAEAVAQLRKSGLYPTQIGAGVSGAAKRQAQKAQKQRVKARAGASGKVGTKTLMIFTRQLATLVEAGLPLLRGLSVLAGQEKNRIMQSTINQLADSVQSGSTFSEGLGQHPKIFDKLFVNMVKAGELGGVLEIVLSRLAEYLEKAQKLKNRIVAAMVYPIIVMVIAIGILCFLLGFIVPKFKAIFDDMLQGRTLPGLTQFIVDISDVVKSYWWMILIGIVLFWGMWRLFASSKGGRKTVDGWKMKLPGVGPVQLKSSISRFARTLGTLVTSGVPILQALNITRDTAGNLVVADAIEKVHEAVREGESVVAPLEASRIFPPMVTSMVQVGEETGQLPDMLLKVADVYDDEVDNAVDAMTSMIEPVMIVFLALVVGTIVIALFLPMIDILQGLQQ